MKTIYLVNHGGTHKTAEKYNIPTGFMVSRWIRKYKESGPDALRENRGKSLGHAKGRPRKIELSTDQQILKLQAENEFLRKIVEQRENILKKKK